ncbi:unnamed protein product [Arabidopsis halleri]
MDHVVEVVQKAMPDRPVRQGWKLKERPSKCGLQRDVVLNVYSCLSFIITILVSRSCSSFLILFLNVHVRLIFNLENNLFIS